MDEGAYRECHNEVKQKGRAEENCAAVSAEERGNPEADHRANGRGHTVVRVTSQSSLPAGKDCIWWVSSGHGDVNKKKQRKWWCAARVGQYDWRNPNRILVIQDSTDRSEAKVFGAHAPPNGVCENLMCSLKLLANRQLGSGKR